MLIEFRVENFRSIRDEQAFTMESGGGGDPEDGRPRKVKGSKHPILPVAAIYGANASGKSNVLAALAFMKTAVVQSHRRWGPDQKIPRDPFAWGPKRDEPSLFEVTILIDSVRYQFGFVVSDDCFIEEWLYAWPHGKKQVWYTRDNGKFKFGEHLGGDNWRIEAKTCDSALFLSTAVNDNHPRLGPVFDWFRQLDVLGLPKPRYADEKQDAYSDHVSDLIDESQRTVLFVENDHKQLFDEFVGMLRHADIGVLGMRTVIATSGDAPDRSSRIQIQLQHQSSHGDAWLPLVEESKGTQKLFFMVFALLQAIQDGNVILIDELESSLHPIVALEIVKLFNDPRRNSHHAQLLFSTHDTSLLGSTVGDPVLRRDQVWLTEKDSEGATVLHPLTDYKPRKAENLERGYLQGRYGAIPFLGNFAFANAESRHE